MSDDGGFHAKDYAMPLIALGGIVAGWIMSIISSVSRMQVELTEIRTKQAVVLGRLDGIDARLKDLDQNGTRALDALKERLAGDKETISEIKRQIEGLACKRIGGGECE